MAAIVIRGDSLPYLCASAAGRMNGCAGWRTVPNSGKIPYHSMTTRYPSGTCGSGIVVILFFSVPVFTGALLAASEAISSATCFTSSLTTDRVPNRATAELLTFTRMLLRSLGGLLNLHGLDLR